MVTGWIIGILGIRTIIVPFPGSTASSRSGREPQAG